MIAALLAAAGLAAAPPAPEAPPRAPTKGWVVDYADTFCSASREYGDAQNPLLFVLRPSPTGELLQLFVIRPSHYVSAEHIPVTLDYAGRTEKTTALVYGSHKTSRRFLLVNLGGEAATAVAKAKTVAIRSKDGDFAFAVPGMPQAMAALETCNADLRALWNISDEKRASIAVPAKPAASLASWVGPEDYPAQALREDVGGSSKVLLFVNEQGKVADCLLVETSGNASLDAMTCIAMRDRGKFQPALDGAGKPMRSVYRQKISWRLSP